MSHRTTWTYRGWRLVETGHNYYSACKGAYRISIGSPRHGDLNELTERFKRLVDGMKDGAR